MPFEVSKIKISLIDYPSYSSFGWLNRDDRNSFTAITSANSFYTQGDSIELLVNSSVNLMKASPSSYQWSQFYYAFKLYPGYLSFGVDATKGTGSGVVKVVLRKIQLNIIAYK